MVRRFLKTLVIAPLILLVALAVGSCDSNTDQPDTGEPERPETFESDQAPYRVPVPSGWKLIAPEKLKNPHADFAAREGEDLYMMVIPQKLPDIDGVDPPGAEALKRASLERMRGNIDQFQIEQEGPVTLEGGEGTSLFAEGIVEKNPVQYIATFVTHGSWGYQIIAWGPPDAESRLTDSVDALIAGWQFREDSLPSGGPDASQESSADE